MDLKDLRGRVTLVLTPELRQFALAQLSPSDAQHTDLIEWFQAEETPDGSVLDATYGEAEATMIDVILQAILKIYSHGEPDEPATPNYDEHVRTISRY